MTKTEDAEVPADEAVDTVHDKVAEAAVDIAKSEMYKEDTKSAE